jgi:hypothetical protein
MLISAFAFISPLQAGFEADIPGHNIAEIIMRREVQPAQRNLFDCAKRRTFSEGIAQDPSMFEAITAFFIVLSVGILLAHALDALRY